MERSDKVERTQGEKEHQLSIQLTMLADRCDAYLEGKFHEGLSAAGILAVLLLDRGKNQRSLLGQLGKLDDLKLLDSRHPRHGLCLNSARGAWPTAIWPEIPHFRSDFVPFREWWEQQAFQIKFSDITFTRREIVEVLRDNEGAGHFDKKTKEKIAIVRRQRSNWVRSVEKKTDGSETLFVGWSSSSGTTHNDGGPVPVSDHEYCSACCIAEEVLFSLTAEPSNRKRMTDARLQRRLYLDQQQIAKCKRNLAACIETMGIYPIAKKHLKNFVDGSISSLLDLHSQESLTSLDYDRAQAIVAQLRDLADVEVYLEEVSFD